MFALKDTDSSMFLEMLSHANILADTKVDKNIVDQNWEGVRACCVFSWIRHVDPSVKEEVRTEKSVKSEEKKPIKKDKTQF